jgi:hypothetical protein
VGARLLPLPSSSFSYLQQRKRRQVQVGRERPKDLGEAVADRRAERALLLNRRGESRRHLSVALLLGARGRARRVGLVFDGVDARVVSVSGVCE